MHKYTTTSMDKIHHFELIINICKHLCLDDCHNAPGLAASILSKMYYLNGQELQRI